MLLSLQKRSSRQSGFTLVELAIVLLIIGIFLGGILRMNEILFIAKARRVMAESNETSAAIKGFQDKYGGLPGDFPQASVQIAGCQPGNANFCTNGDGNTIVGCHVGICGFTNSGWDQDQTGATFPAVETSLFWKHLAITHYIKGVIPNANPANPAWSMTHPSNPLGGGYEIFVDTENAGSSVSIRSQVRPTGMIDVGQNTNLTGKQAKYMDEKYDDGLPGSGFYWAIPPAADGCRINARTYNPAIMDVPNACTFHYIMH